MSIAPAAVFVFNVAGMEELVLLYVLELHLMVLFSFFFIKRREHTTWVASKGLHYLKTKCPRALSSAEESFHHLFKTFDMIFASS
jgi:hypothetical protein